MYAQPPLRGTLIMKKLLTNKPTKQGIFIISQIKKGDFRLPSRFLAGNFESVLMAPAKPSNIF